MVINYLKSFRDFHKITQLQMSEILGVTLKTYGLKESSNNFTRNEMLKIYEFAKTIDESTTINTLFSLPE